MFRLFRFWLKSYSKKISTQRQQNASLVRHTRYFFLFCVLMASSAAAHSSA
jgi:hypothetical protein